MKKLLLTLIAGCLILSGCQKAPATVNSVADQTPAPSSSASSLADEELMAQGRKYLKPVFYASMTKNSWESPAKIDAGDFLTFYLYAAHNEVLGFALPKNLVKDENMDPRIPADIVESEIKKYFDVTSEHLRTGEYYDAKTNEYILYGLGGASHCTVTNVSLIDQKMKIDFKGDQDGELFQTGSLYLQQNGDSFTYTSCDVQKVESVSSSK